MVLPHGTGDLYHKYRPLKFKEVAGHQEVISSIRSAVTSGSPSRAFLLIGDSGTGKTTTARIMALSLNCLDKDDVGEPCLKCKACSSVLTGNCMDITEVNAADNRGINEIRAISRSMRTLPMLLTYKVFILDEAHKLTSDAQSSLLKELEEAPDHVFIILCSTHPKNILPTVKNRCQQFKFSSLRKKEMVSLIEEVAVFESQLFDTEILNAIADAAAGSPRNGLVKLQQVIQLDTKDKSKILRLLEGEDESNEDVFKLCMLLSKSHGPKDWPRVVAAYNDCSSMGAPAIGMMLAGFFRNRVLKGSQASLNLRKLELFLEPFPDGKLGENKLVYSLAKAIGL